MKRFEENQLEREAFERDIGLMDSKPADDADRVKYMAYVLRIWQTRYPYGSFGDVMRVMSNDLNDIAHRMKGTQ